MSDIVDDLEGLIEDEDEGCEWLPETIVAVARKAKDEIVRLRAERAETVDALRPFAEYVESMNRHVGSVANEVSQAAIGSHRVTAGEFRIAADVVARYDKENTDG